MCDSLDHAPHHPRKARPLALPDLAGLPVGSPAHDTCSSFAAALGRSASASSSTSAGTSTSAAYTQKLSDAKPGPEERMVQALKRTLLLEFGRDFLITVFFNKTKK